MLLKVGIVLVVVYVSTVNTQSEIPPVIPYCSGDVCYIRPESTLNFGKKWTEAQQICKKFSSTLPILDNPDHQKSFEAAARCLLSDKERNGGIWLGANALYNQPRNWTWLDGSNYLETEVQQQQGDYGKNYAYIMSDTTTGVRAHASDPKDGHSYICYYPNRTDLCTNGTGKTVFHVENRCFVKFDEQLPWFSARNACLTYDGDLASFSNISLLEGKIIGSKEYWVGLRNSKWIWQNEVTGSSSDVKFTLWCSDQPNDPAPTCISTDAGKKFPGWRDWNCIESLPFICQVNATLASMSTSATCATPSTTVVTPKHTMTRSSTIENNSSTTHSPSSKEEKQKNDTGSVDTIALGVGIGVGVGVPVVIVLIVIIVIFVRRKRQNSTTSGNSQSRKTFVSGNSHRNPEMDTTEMSETQNGGTRMDNSAAQYATITEATGPKLNPPSMHSTVYEGLSFDQAGSS